MRTKPDFACCKILSELHFGIACCHVSWLSPCIIITELWGIGILTWRLDKEGGTDSFPNIPSPSVEKWLEVFVAFGDGGADGCCLNSKRRQAPKLKPTMIGRGPSVVRWSLCQDTFSLPSAYRFANAKFGLQSQPLIHDESPAFAAPVSAGYEVWRRYRSICFCKALAMIVAANSSLGDAMNSRRLLWSRDVTCSVTLLELSSCWWVSSFVLSAVTLSSSCRRYVAVVLGIVWLLPCSIQLPRLL